MAGNVNAFISSDAIKACILVNLMQSMLSAGLIDQSDRIVLHPCPGYRREDQQCADCNQKSSHSEPIPQGDQLIVKEPIRSELRHTARTNIELAAPCSPPLALCLHYTTQATLHDALAKSITWLTDCSVLVVFFTRSLSFPPMVMMILPILLMMMAMCPPPLTVTAIPGRALLRATVA